jgi:Cu(I)/Ag(I) efflux system membrane fusion protein
MTTHKLPLAGLVIALSAFGCRPTNDPANDEHIDAPSHSVSPLGEASTHAAEAKHAQHGSSTAAPLPEDAAHGQTAPAPTSPTVEPPGALWSSAGYTSIAIPPERARAIGLQTAPVEERDFSKLVRTTGTVVLDETRTSHVHSKVRGWIESIDADFVGKSITAGAPLCAIYSQEVLAAQLEFLSVLNQTARAPHLAGPLGDAEQRAREQLVAAARGRLELWDVPATEISRIERTGQARRTFTLNAPRTGIIVSKQALAGMFIDPSVELYVISDIRKLWVVASLYATDVAGIRLGAPATLSIEGQAKPVPAEVAFLPPTIEETTRTLEVRFDVDNGDGTIRPGAFATVELRIDLGRSLAIPEAAVILAGPQAIAFAVNGDRIEPRSVQLGPLVDGYYGVQSGLGAGESVATGAQFLIDSESRLRATSGQGPSHGGH